MEYNIEGPVINKIERCKPLLGTFVEISISADVSDPTLMTLSNRAFTEIENIHKLMSFHEPDSELSKINRDAYTHSVPLSPSTEWVISNAIELSKITNGSYDVTIANDLMRHGGLPALYSLDNKGSWRDVIIENHHIFFEKEIKIDLGGIAKGFAVDQAMDILSKENVPYEQISINAGGDLRLLNWQNEIVKVRHPSPHKRGEFIDVAMQAPSLATSAPNYTNKNSLIIDPESNEILESKDSISVFADKCMLADALTKIVFLSSKYLSVLDVFRASALTIDLNGHIRQIQ